MKGSSLDPATADGAPSRAVVLGAGISGLLAAHVACRHFDAVVVLERDQLGGRVGVESVEQSGKRRSGVPQFCHPHVLLMGGLHAAEQLLPGFKEELRQQGGLPMDGLQDFHTFDFCNDNSTSRGPSALKFFGASRRLVEQVVRERVLRDNAGTLEVRDGARAEELCWSEDRAQVTGVLLKDGEVVPADLVIDASGRYSRLPAWLEAAGWSRPGIKTVDSQLCYTSRTVQLPEDGDLLGESIGDSTAGAAGAAATAGAAGAGRQATKAIIIYGRPEGKRGGALLPQELHTATVSLYGYLGDQAPTDDEGFLQYAASLPDPALHRALLRCKPVSPTIKYAGLKNVLRCYHEMEMPAGVVAVGDSVMELNPAYGQGMTVAAMGVLALDGALNRMLGAAGAAQRMQAGLRQLAGSFQRDLFAKVAAAWMMASSEDTRYPGARIEGVTKPPRLLSAYMDTVVRAGLRHRPTYETFYLVGHFMKPVWALFTPWVLWQVAKQVARETWPGGLGRLAHS